MSQTIEGHSFLSHRPDAVCRVLWRVERELGHQYRWEGDKRLHGTQADAYDAIGFDPSQAPQEP